MNSAARIITNTRKFKLHVDHSLTQVRHPSLAECTRTCHIQVIHDRLQRLHYKCLQRLLAEEHFPALVRLCVQQSSCISERRNAFSSQCSLKCFMFATYGYNAWNALEIFYDTRSALYKFSLHNNKSHAIARKPREAV